MEACGGANYWAREMLALGHEVKLIAPQYVKPYVKGNKNDYNDAEAIAEAAQRPRMRLVPIKSIEQPDIQNLHRQRERIKKARTALANQVRGLLAEYGVVLNKGIRAVRQGLPDILEDGDNGLTMRSRALFAQLLEELHTLDERLKSSEQQIEASNQDNEICGRLDEILGIGPITASATYAAAGEGKNIVNGRHFSAWVGLVPGQHSTGAGRLCSGSVNGEMRICEPCLSMAPERCCDIVRARTIVLASGRKRCWREEGKTKPALRWPIKWREPRG